jgi:hypothetical protein
MKLSHLSTSNIYQKRGFSAVCQLSLLENVEKVYPVTQILNFLLNDTKYE